MTSPLVIKIGLHYWTSPTDYGFDSTAVREAHEAFVSAGLLEKLAEPNKHGAMYKPTPGLDMWVKALCSVPWPIQKWIQQ